MKSPVSKRPHEDSVSLPTAKKFKEEKTPSNADKSSCQGCGTALTWNSVRERYGFACGDRVKGCVNGLCGLCSERRVCRPCTEKGLFRCAMCVDSKPKPTPPLPCRKCKKHLCADCFTSRPFCGDCGDDMYQCLGCGDYGQVPGPYDENKQYRCEACTQAAETDKETRSGA